MLGPLLTMALLRVAGANVAAMPRRAAGRAVDHRHVARASISRRMSCARWSAGGRCFLPARCSRSLSASRRIRPGAPRRHRPDDGIFASVPGGAAEMAVLGERFGARVDRVAAAQSLRILIVVTLVPTSFALSACTAPTPTSRARRCSRRAVMRCCWPRRAAGSLRGDGARLPNAFVLGSLAVAIPLTATSIDLSSMPTLASNLGAVPAGLRARLALSARFPARRAAFRRPRRRHRVGGDCVSAVFALIAGAVSGLHAATLILAMAPGRHRRNVHHREGAATRRAARHRLPRDAPGHPAALHRAAFCGLRMWRQRSREDDDD